MRYRTLALGFCLGLGFTTLPMMAEAARSDGRSAQNSSASRSMSVRGGYSAMPASRSAARQSRGAHSRGHASRRGSYGYSAGISCVPYARQVTGMEISGNGRDWWHNAAGRYARSSRPEPGAILSFPSSGGMSAGHVAVVSRVINSRLIEIDHANWGGPGIRRGSVMQGVDVMDVSANNDWTQVRVQVGWSNENFGRPYPTHGFILNRPDTGSGSAYASYTSEPGFTAASWQRGGSRSAASRPSAIRNVAYRPAANRPATARQPVIRTAAVDSKRQANHRPAR
jgi:surface antigen